MHRKFYGGRPRGTPPSAELNLRGVAKYSNFGPIEGYISETVQDKGKFVLITNRKWHELSIGAKIGDLNDLERRSGRYFASFQRNR